MRSDKLGLTFESVQAANAAADVLPEWTIMRIADKRRTLLVDQADLMNVLFELRDEGFDSVKLELRP